MLGVNISIIQNGKSLLTKREDFEIWRLPGGAVDEGESIAQTASREAREESGLIVERTRLVGLYSRPGFPGTGHIASFLAQPVGGELKTDSHEVIDLVYFAPHVLPDDLLWWHKPRISDAFNGVSEVVWSQTVDYPFDRELTRAEIYHLRSESGLARRDYYFRTLGKMNNAKENQEVG